MPSLFNPRRENSMQLHFKKKSGKWTKRQVEIKESSDKKHYIEIYGPLGPVTRAIRKLGSDVHIQVEISTHSHAIVRDTTEDKCKLLSLVSLKKTKQPLYQFAAYSEQEYNDLDNLANSLEKSCDITSFEASVDADSNSYVPSGPVLLHIYKHNACLTSRSPCIRVLHQWELIEPLAEFQWERYGFRISDHNSNTHYFLFVNSQEVIKKIQQELKNNCKKIYSSDSIMDGVIKTPTKMTGNDGMVQGSHLPVKQSENSPALDQEYPSPLQLNDECDPVPLSDIETASQVSPRRQSPICTPIKEQVEIRYPDYQKRRCKSETAIPPPPYKETIKIVKSHSFHNTNNYSLHERKNLNDNQQNSNDIKYDLIPNDNSKNNESSKMDVHNCDITQHDLSEYYANVQLRPKFYMYMNVKRDDLPEPEAPNTYVNIFSGSSFKGCYENWQLQSSMYSTIPAVLPPPPLPPKPCPPRLPPRRPLNDGGRKVMPDRPPPLPPKPRSPAPFVNIHPPICTTPRIQVALFAANPVSGRVWFLRVAFMHQDANDTTFKRVKDIEAFSNHRLLKTNSLEVTTDSTIEVTINDSNQGFLLLNGNKQNIEKSDIEDLRKGDWFIVEFHIQNSDETENHLIGNVSIGPQTTCCRRTCKADMGIDEIFQRNFKESNPSRSDTQLKRSLLSDYHKRQKFCRALDVTIYSQSHDWRQVAGSLGFTHAEIMELQDKACRSVTFSPTDEVLTIWERRDPACSLGQLVNILRELGRLDVVQDLGYSITLES